MSRYIDAEWLKIALELYRVVDLSDAPSIEIIRCGECKYYIDNTCDCYSLYGDLSGDLIGVSFEPNEDFFCSYGEREGEW